VEFAGYDTGRNAVRGRMLVDGLADVYPLYPRGGQVVHWSGLRPLTPSGRPIIGETRWKNVSLNTGHGPLGWTLAAGSALALASRIDGRPPPFDLGPFLP
jgi:D-amino-acid dehydrogenase